MEKRVRLSRWKDWLLVFVFMGVFLAPRLIDLGTYATADEPLYLKSSASFYVLLREGRFNETDLIIHPGVVNLWAGAAAFFAVFPDYINQANAGYPIADLHFRGIFQNSGHTQPEMLAVGRAVTILFQTLILGAALYFCLQVISRWQAFLGFLLISFDPFYFANSRILQPDGILAASLLLSVIAFIDFLQNDRRSSLVASGIGAGLCWLSKLVGIVLGPIVVGIAVIFWWQNQRGDRRKKMLMIRALIIWLVVALLVFIALWPVMWVDPVGTLMKYFERSFFLSQDVNSPMFFNGELNPEGEFGFKYFYYYIVVIFSQTTPLILLGLVLGAAAYYWKWGQAENEGKASFPYVGLLISLVIFLIIMTLSGKKADRYVLSAFILLDLLAGAGYWLLIKGLQRIFPNFKANIGVAVVTLVVGLQAFLVWRVAPYYHSYYNPLLGSADRYFEKFQIGWGEGLDQAANYLNSQEKIKKKVVYSWYSATFDLFFDYRSKEIHIPPSLLDVQFEEIMAGDYAVIYISQWQRQPNTILLQYLADKQPEYTVEINGFEYVKVYNLADVHVQAGD